MKSKNTWSNTVKWKHSVPIFLYSWHHPQSSNLPLWYNFSFCRFGSLMSSQFYIFIFFLFRLLLRVLSAYSQSPATTITNSRTFSLLQKIIPLSPNGQYMKWCSTSPIIRKMQTKPQWEYYFTSIRMAIIKKVTEISSIGGVEK